VGDNIELVTLVHCCYLKVTQNSLC